MALEISYSGIRNPAQLYQQTVEQYFDVFAVRGTSSGSSSSRTFGVDRPAGYYGGYNLASKVMTGYGQWNGSDTRISFPTSFVYRCHGLMISFIDDQGANWDSTFGRSNPTAVMLAGTYDASGFNLYQKVFWDNIVTNLPINTFSYSYAAFGC